MNRRMRAAQQEQKAAQKAAEKTTYFILDKHAEQIGGQQVTAKMKREGIQLTADQAAFYIASGTIGTEDPSESKAAQKAVEEHNSGEGVEPQKAPEGPTPGIADVTPTKTPRQGR